MKQRPLLALCLLLFASGGMAQPFNANNYRTIDGSFNNLQNPTWGAAGARLLRVSGTAYADGIAAPGGIDRPNPRLISNAIFAQENFMPAPQGLSDYMWVWGQTIDHDFGLTPDVNEPLLIPIPTGDPQFDPFGTGQAVIPIHRNRFDPATGTSPANPRQHVNIISSYIDASFVYGDNNARAAWLRTFNGGKLKVSAGNYLPYNTTTGELNGPIDPQAPPMGNPVGMTNVFFVAGDERANENPLLAGLHTLFVREHNRLCTELARKHPIWTDEQLYQHARKYVSGFVQAITYQEWLPQLGVPVPSYTGYKSNVNATLANEFTAAAFRLGHTLLNGTLQRLDNNGEVIAEGHMLLRDAFFNPMAIVNTPGGLDPFFKGMAVQTMQQFDAKIVNDIRNFLFGAPGSGGMDLAAINIMRGRERGLPDFNTIRAAYGLTPYGSFPQINSSSVVFSALFNLYGNVNNIDPWVGFLAEQASSHQSVLGPTLQRILQVQFTALRDGDRLYYENDPILTADEKALIRNTKLRDIIVRNSNLPMLQDNVFRAMPHSEICDNMHVKIYGHIRTAQNDPVSGVNLVVDMIGNDLSLVSDAFGAYSFDEVKGCEVQGFTLQKDDTAARGVSTLDLLIAQRHILGVAMLDSPYKLLAADVNRSGGITTLDLVLIRRVILGIADAFPGNVIWRFIPVSHVFDDPENPFADNIVEPPMQFDLMALDYEGEFVGIKTGDVNGSAATELFNQQVEVRNTVPVVAIHTSDRTFRRGETLELTLSTEAIAALAGFQMELDFGKALELVEVDSRNLPESGEHNFGIFPAEGLITMSWSLSNPALRSSITGNEFLTLRFLAIQDGRLSEALSIGKSRTPAEAYTDALERRSLQLVFDQQENSVEGFSLYPNRPNPVSSTTVIPFHLPIAGLVRLTISDAAGRGLYSTERRFDQGYNEWFLDRKDLNASGVVFFRVESPQGALTRKMLLID